MFDVLRRRSLDRKPWLKRLDHWMIFVLIGAQRYLR